MNYTCYCIKLVVSYFSAFAFFCRSLMLIVWPGTPNVRTCCASLVMATLISRLAIFLYTSGRCKVLWLATMDRRFSASMCVRCLLWRCLRCVRVFSLGLMCYLNAVCPNVKLYWCCFFCCFFLTILLSPVSTHVSVSGKEDVQGSLSDRLSGCDREWLEGFSHRGSGRTRLWHSKEGQSITHSVQNIADVEHCKNIIINLIVIWRVMGNMFFNYFSGLHKNQRSAIFRVNRSHWGNSQKNPLICWVHDCVYAVLYFREITIVRLSPEEIVMVMEHFIARFF